MSEPTRIPTPDGVAPAAQNSHVVMGAGRFVAVSGRLPPDADGRLAGVGDPAAQARQVFENLRRCPAAAGATFADVVELTCFVTDTFVTDTAHLPAVRAARAAQTPDERLPASPAVQVAALVRPEFLMEIEAYAVVGE
ncbi:Rid family hydrolase [Streptomyces sp. NPDC020801]|uniref:Rid family hydrolase n=1 Tax=unclassified Streptomyces TaxID=2593676 RepID=UPI0037A3699C